MSKRNSLMGCLNSRKDPTEVTISSSKRRILVSIDSSMTCSFSMVLRFSNAKRSRKSIRARASKYIEHSHGNQSSVLLTRVTLESKSTRCPCIALPEPCACRFDPPPPHLHVEQLANPWSYPQACPFVWNPTL